MTRFYRIDTSPITPYDLYQVRLITYDMSLRVKRSGTKQSLRTLRLLHFAIAAFVMTSIYPDMMLRVD
ncbi:MAG: hypothetical protein V7K72_08170 [Nostoc sp.]|uniref:hypothetical protein n=1 Tax=Nostoc sp. TaxID=1180 RepID=UPI002FF9DDDC